MDFKDSSDFDVIRPKTEPVSPSLVDFSKQSVSNLKKYKSSDRKDITPSSISTPSTSYGSRAGKRVQQQYKQMNGVSEVISDELNKQYTMMNQSRQELVEDENTKEKESSTKKAQRCCKCTLVLVVLLAGIAGVVVVIVTNNDTKYPSAQKQTSSQTTMCNISIPDIVQYLQKVPVSLNCTFSEDVHKVVKKMKVTFDPKFVYSGEIVEHDTNINGTNFTIRYGRWQHKCNFTNKNMKCEFLREPVRCDSGGRLTVKLYKDESLKEKEIEKDVEFDVEGGVSQVDLSLNQTIDESSNSSVFDISCSAKMSCTPTTLWLFSQKDGQIVRRFDINFTCIVQYNVEDGTTIDCTGSIPVALLDTFGTILCRSDFNDSSDAKTKEASICVGDECTFDCPDDEADIYYVDPLDCTIVHRCAAKRLYSGPCANSTYFNPDTCSCDHVDKVKGCDSNGKRIEKLENTRCGAANND